MRIRCPHCHNPVEIVDDSSFKDIPCPSCGSSFSLIADTDTTQTYRAGEKTIAHFTLTERLGLGAHGEVWKAKDTRLDRTVAVKIPRKEQLSYLELEGFLREARAAGQLRHPNIVSVHEVGKDDDKVYIVTDYVQGADLKRWLGEQPLSPREAAELCAKVADALHHAHQRGVIHRDLKPSNIMMNLDCEPHIMDFGLAKRESGEVTMTVDGAILGTPPYMSPEQANGKGHEADRRTDVYSLGVILFEMLTASLPFVGDERMLIVQILTDDPPQPRRRNSRVPKDLETVCLKCLRKEPEKRYQSASELAADIRRWMNGEPIVARPVSRTEKAWMWCRNRPAVSVLTLAIIIVLLTSIAVVLVERRRSQALAVKTAVDSLQKLSGQTIPFAIRELKMLPDDLVLAELRKRLAASEGRRELAVAYALAAYGEIDVTTLLGNVGEAGEHDCSNIVAALRGVQPSEIQEALTHIQQNEDAIKHDWHLKSRLAILGLHIRDPRLAIDVHRIADRPDPTQQSVFIHDVFPNWHGDLDNLAKQVRSVDNAPLQAGICLAVGNLEEVGDAKPTWKDLLSQWYAESPDSGVHSAAGWTLRQWNVALPSTTDIESPNHRWKTTPWGLTMIRIPAGGFVRVLNGRTRQKVSLTRDFWLSDVEVSAGLFQQFLDDKTYLGLKPKGWKEDEFGSPTADHPAQSVSWEEAVLFCNWLSHQEELTACYSVEEMPGRTREPLKYSVNEIAGSTRESLKVEPVRNGTGYRLPTEAEWEHACRAGTTTHYGFGDEESRLPKYGVFFATETEPLGSKMCNRWGLFDMHGNVAEWVYDRYGYSRERATVVDPVGPSIGSRRVCRGGRWGGPPSSCRSSSSNSGTSADSYYSLGFRVARSSAAEHASQEAQPGT